MLSLLFIFVVVIDRGVFIARICDRCDYFCFYCYSVRTCIGCWRWRWCLHLLIIPGQTILCCRQHATLQYDARHFGHLYLGGPISAVTTLQTLHPSIFIGNFANPSGEDFFFLFNDLPRCPPRPCPRPRFWLRGGCIWERFRAMGSTIIQYTI